MSNISGSSHRFWREVLWVAGYELAESMRTRLFVLVVLAYVGAMGMMNALFVLALKELEQNAAEVMRVPTTVRPGAMLAELIKSGKLDDMAELIGGSTELLMWHPLALWAMAVSMVLLPVLVTFTSATTISEEVRNRSIRYLACRTGRLQIGLGKMLGQVGLLMVAALAGVGVTVGFGGLAMIRVPLDTLTLDLLFLLPRALGFSIPFLGLGLMASQLVSSGNSARLISAVLLIGMPVSHAWLAGKVGLDLGGRLADLAMVLLPVSGWSRLWSVDGGILAGELLRCGILGVAFFSVGFLFFQRRDV